MLEGSVGFVCVCFRGRSPSYEGFRAFLVLALDILPWGNFQRLSGMTNGLRQKRRSDRAGTATIGGLGRKKSPSLSPAETGLFRFSCGPPMMTLNKAELLPCLASAQRGVVSVLG